MFKVFSVARYSPVGANERVPFDTVLVDTTSSFDETKAVYTARSSGFYFFHMSAGVPAYQRVNLALHNASSIPNLILTHTTLDGELVMSRDDIQYVSENQSVYLSSDYPLYSDSLLQTSWSGLRLNEFMSPLVLFRAARTSSYEIVDSNILYDKLLINVGQVWDQCNNQLVVRQAGIYFLSWSTASVPDSIHISELQLNGISVVRLPINNGYYSGSDTASQSVLLALNAGDLVTIFLHNGSAYSDSSYQTSFSGFLYEPYHGQKVAWSLGFPYSLDNHTYAYGPADIIFTNILLNEGLAWNISTGILTIPLSGLYYLKLSGVSYPLQYKFNLGLSVNGQLLMNVMDKTSSSLRTKYYTLRSRSLITRLQQGDKLVVSVPAGYNTASDQNELLFVGFFIY